MADRPSILEIYWILMKTRVVLLLQATAICGVLVYDFKEGHDSGKETMWIVWCPAPWS